MQEYELYILFDMLEYSDFSLKEMSRLIMLVQAQVYSKKKLKATDLLDFPWDKEESGEEDVTQEEKDRVKNLGKKFEEIFSKK